MTTPAPAAGSLARRIYDRSHLAGEFRLRSGATSDEYFDKYLFESDPELLREIAQALGGLLPERVDAVAGLELGGVPLATSSRRSRACRLSSFASRPRPMGPADSQRAERLRGVAWW